MLSEPTIDYLNIRLDEKNFTGWLGCSDSSSREGSGAVRIEWASPVGNQLLDLDFSARTFRCPEDSTCFLPMESGTWVELVIDNSPRPFFEIAALLQKTDVDDFELYSILPELYDKFRNFIDNGDKESAQDLFELVLVCDPVNQEIREKFLLLMNDLVSPAEIEKEYERYRNFLRNNNLKARNAEIAGKLEKAAEAKGSGEVKKTLLPPPPPPPPDPVEVLNTAAPENGDKEKAPRKPVNGSFDSKRIELKSRLKKNNSDFDARKALAVLYKEYDMNKEASQELITNGDIYLARKLTETALESYKAALTLTPSNLILLQKYRNTSRKLKSEKAISEAFTNAKQDKTLTIEEASKNPLKQAFSKNAFGFTRKSKKPKKNIPFGLPLNKKDL
jgi:tetratricopeptide (TPR) repeat protein